MRKSTQRLPTSVYIVLTASFCANAIVTFIMLRYFM